MWGFINGVATMAHAALIRQASDSRAQMEGGPHPTELSISFINEY